MPKAVVKLPNGTVVEIEGSPEEVQRLLAFYGLPTQEPKKARATKRRVGAVAAESMAKKDVPTQEDLATLINLVRTSEEAEAIETNILDRTSEVNRVLLPLYIAHKHMGDSFGLTTVEIAAITTDLGIRVFRQNVFRALTGSGARYVIGDRVRKPGQATRYKLNRRGLQYMKEVLEGASGGQ
jgi:hypothetical protein